MDDAARIVTDHISGFKNEIQKAAQRDASSFFNWFDESGGDVDTNFIRGQCDFSFYVLMPLIEKLKDTRNKTALEIGYGGGRLLAAAAHSFKKVIGIDIHKNAQIVEEELKKRNIHNFELLLSSGKDIPVKDSSIDLVYSFIVLQHVEKIDIFNHYLSEAYRILKEGSYAVLFFGRLYVFSEFTSSKLLYNIDRVLEGIYLKGYKEVPAQINVINLKISMNYARRKAEKKGFSVVAAGVSRKLPNVNIFGGQNYLILKKPVST